MTPRQPSPRKRPENRPSRRVARQELKSTHLRQALPQAILCEVRAEAEPETVNVPAFASAGASFSCNFIKFTYFGEKSVSIGAVRKKRFVVWKCRTPGRNEVSTIALPYEGGEILVSEIMRDVDHNKAENVEPEGLFTSYAMTGRRRARR